MTPDIEDQKRAQHLALEAQRTGLIAALDMHVKRSEEIALQVHKIDQEIQEITEGLLI